MRKFTPRQGHDELPSTIFIVILCTICFLVVVSIFAWLSFLGRSENEKQADKMPPISSTLASLDPLQLAKPGPPHFVIAGSWKSGTTSLLHYVQQHQNVCMAQEHFSFFKHPELFELGIDWWKEQNKECTSKPNALVGLKAASYFHDIRVAKRFLFKLLWFMRCVCVCVCVCVSRGGPCGVICGSV